MQFTSSDISTAISCGFYVPSRTIFLAEEVDEKMAKKVQVLVHFFDKAGENVRVVINSNGGNVVDGFAIYDALRACRAHVTTLVAGEACSMAALIAQAGDTRLITPNSRMMLHAISKSMSMDYISYVEAGAKEGRRLMKVYGGIMEERMGLREGEFWRKYEQKESWFGPGEAVAAGLVDGIVEGSSEDLEND